MFFWPYRLSVSRPEAEPQSINLIQWVNTNSRASTHQGAICAEGIERNLLLERLCLMKTPRNNEAKTRGRPFQPGNAGRFRPGNAGRPKGARHKVSLAVEALLDGEAEGLTRKAIQLGLAGT